MQKAKLLPTEPQSCHKPPLKQLHMLILGQRSKEKGICTQSKLICLQRILLNKAIVEFLPGNLVCCMQVTLCNAHSVVFKYLSLQSIS